MRISVLLSGSTGFLGKIIKETLSNDFQIKTIGKNNCDFNFDFSKTTQIKFEEEFDLIIHCAGKAHFVPKTEKEKEEFYQVNTTGTNFFLENLKRCPTLPKSFVFISSIAVYGLTSGVNIDENAPLNAQDPYGKSKILAEELVEEWCLKNNVVCTILRLPLLIGKNPKGNFYGMIEGIRKGYYFNIGGGTAHKSMVMAADIASFIPIISKIGGIYNLTDGYHPNFNELSTIIAKQLGKRKPKNLPSFLIFIVAKIGDYLGGFSPINSNTFQKMTSDLTFDDSKARKIANWKPTPVINNFSIV
jgi:nucleoside-diphosphate-sugar epimerase